MNLAIMSCKCGCAAKAANANEVAARLFAADTTLWSTDPAVQEKITNRLGWLASPQGMAPHVAPVTKLVDATRAAGFKHVVLLGMGGSSLCPEVLAKVFGTTAGYMQLLVLDSTAPDAVRAIDAQIELDKTLFIPASKSGSTIETNVMYAYFYKKLEEVGVPQPGKHFIAITDPGSSMEALAKEKGFLACFLNPADIGGRFSAISLFGLIPAAFLGIDIGAFLMRTAQVCAADSAFVQNAIAVGLRLGAIAKQGRDKLTFAMSPQLEPLGDWIEQLVAESTGKVGMGILPVVGERDGVWGADRVLVTMKLGDEPVRPLAGAATCPTKIEVEMPDTLCIGMEFLRWELITAAMGVALEVNPFDEPNVTESKTKTGALLKEFIADGALPMPAACKSFGAISVTPSAALKAFAQTSGATCCATEANATIASAIKLLAASAKAGDYVTLSAFIAPTEKRFAQLQTVRQALATLTQTASTLGIGPRFLHSTGQLHKGGANNGLFVVLVADESANDLAIPGYPYGFGTLCLAQGLGDFACLDMHGRRALLLRTGDVDGALAELTEALA